MKAIDPHVAEAIGAILKDMRQAFEDRIQNLEAQLEKALDREPISKEIEAVTGATMALVDERVEWARVNADLWKEQAKNELRTIREDRDMVTVELEDAAELIKGLQEALDEQSAMLDIIKASQLNPVGPYREGMECRPGDVVMRDGSSFVALRKTQEDPRTEFPDPHYRLLAMRGQRGQKGAQGPKGPAGADGVHVLSVDVVDTSLALSMSSGEVLSVDLGPLVLNAFEKVTAQ